MPYQPKLPILTKAEAADAGFESISSSVDLIKEPEIIESMEKNMRGVTAAWMTARTYHQQDGVQLCRMKNQILK